MQIFLKFENLEPIQLESEVGYRIINNGYHIDNINILPSANDPSMINAFVTFSVDESSLTDDDQYWVKCHTKTKQWTIRRK